MWFTHTLMNYTKFVKCKFIHYNYKNNFESFEYFKNFKQLESQKYTLLYFKGFFITYLF